MCLTRLFYVRFSKNLPISTNNDFLLLVSKWSYKFLFHFIQAFKISIKIQNQFKKIFTEKTYFYKYLNPNWREKTLTEEQGSNDVVFVTTDQQKSQHRHEGEGDTEEAGKHQVLVPEINFKFRWKLLNDYFFLWT